RGWLVSGLRSSVLKGLDPGGQRLQGRLEGTRRQAVLSIRSDVDLSSRVRVASSGITARSLLTIQGILEARDVRDVVRVRGGRLTGERGGQALDGVGVEVGALSSGVRVRGGSLARERVGQALDIADGDLASLETVQVEQVGRDLLSARAERRDVVRCVLRHDEPLSVGVGVRTG